MTTESLCFKIDTSWLTDFVRTRYWWEDLPLEDALELLRASFGIKDTSADANFTAVLNGTKRMIGINSAEFVNDNASDQYNAFLERKRIRQIAMSVSEHIDLYPENYIDPFLIKPSITTYKGLIEYMNTEDMYISESKHSKLRRKLKPETDEDFENGLWIN